MSNPPSDPTPRIITRPVQSRRSAPIEAPAAGVEDREAKVLSPISTPSPFTPYVPGQLEKPVPEEEAPKKSAHARRELAVLALVFVAALVLRLVNLESFPDTFNPDEADNFQDIMRNLYSAPRPNGFFGFDWKPQPAYSIYLMTAFVWALGPTVTAVRLPSAIISCLALIPFFFLLRRQFSLAASALACVLLSTNLWYLNFSRSGWENVHISLYMLMAMLCLVLALDRLRRGARHWPMWLLFLATGFFCALGLYGYFGGRAIVIAAAVFFPIALLFYRRRWKLLLAGFALTGVVAAGLFWPQLSFIIENWQHFNNRSATVVILNSPEYKANPLGTIAAQIVRNVQGPWVGSVNQTPRYTPAGEPQLDIYTGILVLAGIFLTFTWPKLQKRPETWLWWTMLLVSWGLTQVLTGNTPDGARGVGWMPTLLFFAAASFEALILLAGRFGTLAGRVAIAISGVAVLLIAGLNVSKYVTWQSDPQTRAARQPYVETRFFPVFAAEVKRKMQENLGGVTAEEWQAIKPLDPGTPGGDAPPLRLKEAHRWLLTLPFDEPLGIAYLDGKVYMADYRGKSLSVLDTATGLQTPIEPRSASGPLSYARPGDVKIGPDKLLYVLNNGPGDEALLVMKPDGEVVRHVALAGKSDVAIGLHVAPDGTFYVTDKVGGRIFKYGPGGGEPLLAWFPEAGFNNISGVFMEEGGTIFGADTENSLVHRFDANGQPLQVYQVGCRPVYMASNGDWVDVSCGSAIMSINKQDGTLQRGRNEPGAPRLENPTGMVYGPDGTLYVRDRGNLIAYELQR